MGMISISKLKALLDNLHLGFQKPAHPLVELLYLRLITASKLAFSSLSSCAAESVVCGPGLSLAHVSRTNLPTMRL